MFHKLLPKNSSIYATTAADPAESSYACFFDNERETYLADVYSINWMLDSDAVNLHNETLEDQFQKVRSMTNTSHVSQYGDIDGVSGLDVASFQGLGGGNEDLRINSFPDAIPSEDVPVYILLKSIAKTRNITRQHELQQRFNQIIAKNLGILKVQSAN